MSAPGEQLWVLSVDERGPGSNDDAGDDHAVLGAYASAADATQAAFAYMRARLAGDDALPKGKPSDAAILARYLDLDGRSDCYPFELVRMTRVGLGAPPTEPQVENESTDAPPTCVAFDDDYYEELVGKETA